MARLVTIVNETNATLPRVAFADIAKSALGPRYHLSVVVTSPARMKELNTIYRDKKEPTDILSFPLTGDEGEIYLCLEEAAREARKFGREFENFVAFLFIHGCVHLKGYDHGATMERIESGLRKKYGI